MDFFWRWHCGPGSLAGEGAEQVHQGHGGEHGVWLGKQTARAVATQQGAEKCAQGGGQVGNAAVQVHKNAARQQGVFFCPVQRARYQTQGAGHQSQFVTGQGGQKKAGEQQGVVGWVFEGRQFVAFERRAQHFLIKRHVVSHQGGVTQKGHQAGQHFFFGGRAAQVCRPKAGEFFYPQGKAAAVTHQTLEPVHRLATHKPHGGDFQ